MPKMTISSLLWEHNKGMEVGGNWVNLLIEGTFMKNIVSDGVEWSSKKLWKMTADVETDVKQ